MELHSKMVFAVCYGLLGDFQEAEDVAQEAFIRGFLRIRSLRNRDKFSSWIARIARNLCIDYLRRRKRKPDSLDNLPEHVAHTAPIKPELIDLQTAIRRLPEDSRFPLVLYYFDGKSAKAIADVLGISVPGVHTRLSSFCCGKLCG